MSTPTVDIRVGPHTYGTPKVLWGGQARLLIGDYCSISQGVVVFLGGEHRTDWVTTWPLKEKGGAQVPTTRSSKGDVTIGSDVWVCQGAIILSGVTIGHGAVVGAFSVVASDVAPYAIVAGNPARFIRYRFDEKTVARLLALAWWDWPFARIQKMAKIMSSPDVQGFLAAAEKGKP